MTLKRIYRFLAAAAVIATVSCSRVEIPVTDSGMAMEFGTYVPKAITKSYPDTFVEGTVLPDDSSFGVFAFYQPGVVGSSTGQWNAATRTPEFMFNQQVDFDGSNYTYSPLRYWPANEENTISFWAYYPYSAWAANNSTDLKFYASGGSTAYSSSSTGLPVVEYTVPADPDDHQDILFSTLKQDKTYANCSPTPGTVDLTFRHALALVEFQVVEGTGAEVYSFGVNNLYRSGTCSTLPTITWTGQGNVSDFSIDADPSHPLNLVGTTTVCSLLIMPQTLRADAEVSITYDIHFASYDPEHPADIVYAGNSGSALLSAAGITEWEAGKHYVYRISAGFERIEFESAVATDWSVGNDNINVN